jgi:chromosome partitioning protein
MHTIAVIGRKGGSGKTTIATQLAIGLHLRGRRVVLADADPQRSSIEVLRTRTGRGPDAVATTPHKLFGLQTMALRSGVDAMVVDTPAVIEESVVHAVVLADLSLLVVRPTFLDLTAAVQTSDIIRRLRKPGLVVLNQAPPARGRVEPPQVKRALTALAHLRLPAAPVVIRSRAAYQTVMASGQSVEELAGERVAAEEMAALCAYVHRFVFGSAVERNPAARTYTT